MGTLGRGSDVLGWVMLGIDRFDLDEIAFELNEEYPRLLPVWYAFRDARAARRAVGWLLDASLVSDDDADRFRAEHPDPPVL